MLNSYTRPQSCASQKGFSLVELMVSILIGLIILAGVVQVVMTSKSTFLVQEDMSYIQENARYALDVLGRDIQGSGYWGCAGAFPKSAVVARAKTGNADALKLLRVNGITGFTDDNNAADQFPKKDDSDGGYERWVNGKSNNAHKTESFIVRFATNSSLTVDAGASSDGKLVLYGGRGQLEKGDYLAVVGKDCTSIGVFNIGNVGDSTSSGVNGVTVTFTAGNTGTNCSTATKPSPLGKSYSCADNNTTAEEYRGYNAGATAMKYVTRGYFIEESGVMPGQPALKRKVLSNDGGTTTEEIALGVEDMALLYGVSTAAGIQLKKADKIVSVEDWNKVLFVQVSLLFRSQFESMTEADGLPKLGNTYTDRYLRQVVTSTFKLRNRIE